MTKKTESSSKIQSSKAKSSKRAEKNQTKADAPVTPQTAEAAIHQNVSKDQPNAQATPSDSPKPQVQVVEAPPPLPPENCLYQLPSPTAISEKELTDWAQIAAVKSFDYNFETLDAQLQHLKACYTDQGWHGFNDALQQSGNLSAIKAQKLTVSSEVAGQIKINPIKTNQWKINLPLKVVYQNTQEKLTQLLSVEMIVVKKSERQLGIVQIIAEPSTRQKS